MEHSETLPFVSDPLSIRKQIDDWCDQFEEAWIAGKRPKIEDFLGKAAPAQRRPLFVELLSLELSLEPPVEMAQARAAYQKRFADLAEAVAEVIGDAASVQSTVITGRFRARHVELVRAVLTRLRAAGQHADVSLDRTLEFVGPQAISERVLLDPTRPAGALWSLLLRRVRTLAADSSGLPADASLVERLSAASRALVAAFPERRQRILICLLGGMTIAEAADQHAATERTVLATAQTAADLLN